MLKKFCTGLLAYTEEGKPLHRLRPLAEAIDVFLYEAPNRTKSAPHIRDAVDLKRWMMLVIFALIPSMVFAIWNSGMQQFVYTSRDFHLLDEFFESSKSLSSYFAFALKDGRYLSILGLGLKAFVPILFISYLVGGIVETIFACVRKTEIAEGFLVTGMLYPLILPPSIPYWMVAFGVAVGVILSKELFGGTGMNIMNPALCCRVLLFFTFPAQMAGEVWIGTNAAQTRASILEMNRQAKSSPYDGFTQATPLAKFNVGFDVKKVHVDAIGLQRRQTAPDGASRDAVYKQFEIWASEKKSPKELTALSEDQLRSFVTDSIQEGGLGLSPDYFDEAVRFSKLQNGEGVETDGNFFFGNRPGSFGETSTLAILLGGLFLIITGVGSWRIMVSTLLGAYLTAVAFHFFATSFGSDGGAWNPAMFAFPAYKHLLMGGLAFGAVFMATDPVSACQLRPSQWIYGFLIGFVVMIIRLINPAYPEGVMLAILVANVFSSLIDHYVSLCIRGKRSCYF